MNCQLLRDTILGLAFLLFANIVLLPWSASAQTLTLTDDLEVHVAEGSWPSSAAWRIHFSMKSAMETKCDSKKYPVGPSSPDYLDGQPKIISYDIYPKGDRVIWRIEFVCNHPFYNSKAGDWDERYSHSVGNFKLKYYREFFDPMGQPRAPYEFVVEMGVDYVTDFLRTSTGVNHLSADLALMDALSEADNHCRTGATGYRYTGDGTSTKATIDDDFTFVPAYGPHLTCIRGAFFARVDGVCMPRRELALAMPKWSKYSGFNQSQFRLYYWNSRGAHASAKVWWNNRWHPNPTAKEIKTGCSKQ